MMRMLRLLIVDNYDTHPEAPMRRKRLGDIVEAFHARSIAIHHSKLANDWADSTDADCIILSGSESNVSEFDKKPDVADSFSVELAGLKACPKPVLGICFGHHLAMHSEGAEVKRNEESDEIKQPARDYSLDIGPDPDGIVGEGRFHANLSHRDYVEPTDAVARKRFDIRAVSMDGRFRYIQYAKHRTRPLFCVQFHPETTDSSPVTVVEDGVKVIRGFLSLTLRMQGQ